MRKWKALWVVLLVIVFFFCALASSSDETADQGTESAEKSNSSAEDSSALGDYSVVIDSCRLAKDYEGKPVVIVKYQYTNVSNDTATAFYVAFDEQAYQNGIGLNEAFMLPDDANYSSDNQMKEIKKGATLDVEVAYTLNDTTTDVEVEVKELFSFSNKTITKTFSIAD